MDVRESLSLIFWNFARVYLNVGFLGLTDPFRSENKFNL